jgi:hypothetical protein
MGFGLSDQVPHEIEFLTVGCPLGRQRCVALRKALLGAVQLLPQGRHLIASRE